MSVSKKLSRLLEENRIDFELIPHSVAYTAQETAASVHRPGREVVKSVLITDGENYALAVVDAPHQVDLEKFAAASGMTNPMLAGEEVMRELFADCEPGAMPPFGNLYGLKVYVDRRLEKDDTITFNACSHFEAIRMKFADFSRLCQPVLADLCGEKQPVS
ncbi:MAG: YbaK/EbsC family protein [Candidatus Glassbacteria bacterium]